MRISLLALVLLPALYYLSGRGNSENSALQRNRKLLESEAKSLIPAASLKNLVLVAGHAVYTVRVHGNGMGRVLKRGVARVSRRWRTRGRQLFDSPAYRGWEPTGC